MMDTKIRFNFFGAPGSGKSTLAAATFSYLKQHRYSVELINEAAKEATWVQDKIALTCPTYLAGQQEYRERLGLKATHGIVTDSPIVLAAFWAHYRRAWPSVVNGIMTTASHKFANLDIQDVNYFVRLMPEESYDTAGRNESYSESLRIEDLLREFLRDHKIPTIPISRNEVEYLLAGVRGIMKGTFPC